MCACVCHVCLCMSIERESRPCFFDSVCMLVQERALCDASRTGLLNVVIILLKHAVAHGSKVDAFREVLSAFLECLMPEAYMHQVLVMPHI